MIKDLLRTLCIALAISGSAWGSVNDAFANRSDLGSIASAVVPYDSRDATRQVGEPSHVANSSTGSLWWRWTAPADGLLWLKISVSGVETNGIRAVYTGSTLTELNKVAETSFNQLLPVPVTAGTIYQIAVADSRAAGLHLDFFPLPANDAFENRVHLGSSADFSIEATTVGGTLQSGEPDGTSQGPTLWWSWQAPADGIVSYDLTGSDSDYWNASAYTGSTLSTLVKRSGRSYGQAANTSTTLRVKAGETFAIQMSRTTSGQVGRFRMNWNLAPQPYQATSADAVDLGSVSSATGSADNRNAVTAASGSDAELWWRWTAPNNGVFRWTAVRTDGSTSQPTPRVFDTNLQQLYPNSTWQAFTCLAGQTFLLSAETSASNAGRFDYHLAFDPSAPNDALGDAHPLVLGQNPFHSVYAGIEPGEPVIPNSSWTRSLWWHWTAPGDGALWLDVELASTPVGIWGLDPVVPPIWSYYNSRQIMAAATAGAVLRIGTLEANSAPKSPSSFTARFIPAATGNDDFANAADLGSEWIVASYGDPTLATREAGEPMPAVHGGSLWWKWTAPGDGNLRIRSRVQGGAGDLSHNTGLWLYRDTEIGSLTPMTGTTVTSGETLWVAVTANSSGTATPIAFELMGAPVHPNDAFASATELGEITTWQPSFYLDATAEPGEPIPQRSLWWKWTAPETGNVFFSIPSGNETCCVYQGNSLSELTLVAKCTDFAGSGFVATAGASYWIGVTGYHANAPVRLDWRFALPPPGDLFAAPIELGQATSFTLAMEEGSLVEPIEAGLFPYGYDQSLWWRWTAPANGKLERSGSWGDTWLLFEQTGGPGAGLMAITDENVIAGNHYRIANILGPYKFTAPAVWTFHATPPNDTHPGAIDLGSATEVTAETDLYAATIDATETSLLENAPYSPSRGVWWRWTAPFDGVLRCRGELLSGSGYLAFTVMRGTAPPAWQRVGGTTSAGSGSSSGECLTSVKAGETYLILLGTNAYAPKLVKFTLSAWPSASNNDWVDAVDLGGGASADASGNNFGASRDPFESNYGSGSVWWKWTATDARNVFVTARIGEDNVILTAYQSSGASLVVVPGASFRNSYSVGSCVSFRSQPGRTYWISVSGANSETVGKVDLALRTMAIPANDDFANRIVLDPELPLEFSGDTAGATVEAGEATYDSSSGSDRNMSLWWSWTAPASGPVRIEITGGNAIYIQTGDSINALTTIKRVWSGNTAWMATAGVTYHFAVGHFGHSGAPFECRLTSLVTSSNDHFATRASLGSATQGQWDTSTLLCTAEVGEPAHGGQTAIRSVWYEWTAPTAGGVLLEAALGGYQARLGIYTGTAVGALQNIAGGSWKVPFIAVAGQTYHIAVDGTEGLGSLKLHPVALPPNDLFANRTVLTGWPLPIKGSTMLAGKETGEPGTNSFAQRTLWWEWVAPLSDYYTISQVGNSSASMAIYSSVGPAASFASLSPVTSVGSGFSNLFITAGIHYYFKVFTSGASTGSEFDFRIDRSQGVLPTPGNDDFASRTDLGSQVGIKVTGDFYGATREAWETGSSNQGSLWWSWTAPSDGVFLLRRSGNQPVTMTIYTGSTTASLVTVATGTGTREWFRAVSGTTYQIRCLTSNTTGSTSSSRLMGLEIMAAGPPANDAFETAVTLPEPGTSTLEGYNAGAGNETLEPSHSGTAARASLWYQWTASIAGPIQISTTSAIMRTGIYQGATLDSLTEVAAGNTPLTFTAVPGEIYRIALDSADDESFFIRLTQPAPAIANDAFLDATPVAGASVEVAGTTVGATYETGESYPTGSGTQGGSAWWTWTAPANGAVEVSATGTTLPHFSIYQGSILESLELVASGSGSCGFMASAGSTYRIAATTTYSTGVGFGLKILQTGNAPSNDAFTHATSLAPHDLVMGTVDGASRETGESWHGSSIVTQTVWYRWTAPASGRARVTLRVGNPGGLLVYRGTTVAGLSLVVSSKIDAGFAVAAGEEFRILIGRASVGISGAFELEIGMTDTGDNDNFANRTSLGSAAVVTWTGALEDATIESGETPGESNNNGSRWWTWTAPADGGVSLKVGDGRIVPAVHVYTGTQLGSLSRLASSTNGNGLAFPARAGTTYQIALRGKPSSTGIGDFQAELSLQHVPNDHFAAATILDGVLPVTGSGWLGGATSELGENTSSGSIWWRWISPISGLVDLDRGASDVSPSNIQVWTGPGLPLLQSVQLSFQIGPIQRFTAKAGTTYWISMSSSQDTVFGTIRFQLRPGSVPPNDHFADALPLAGDRISIDTVSHGATTEAGEPIPSSRPYTNVYSRSLWWNWTAPRNGLLRVRIGQGWAFVYEGASWQDLREVSAPGGATSTTNAYWVKAGHQYRVSAGNSSGGPAVATLELSPLGDHFDDAVQISGPWVKRSGSLADCFWESGEPLHAGSAAQATFWFRWIAPSNGTFRVLAKSGTSTLRAAAYSGNSISTLNERGSAKGSFVFTAVAGQEYRIVVDGGSPAGDFELVLAKELPAYDAWRDSHFDFMDPSSAPDEDPDHDGLINFIEASLGSDPHAFTAGPVFTVDTHQGKIRLNLRRKSGGGWRHSFDLSHSLSNWQSTNGMNRSETIEDHEDGTETLRVLLHDYLKAAHPMLFFRLAAEVLPTE